MEQIKTLANFYSVEQRINVGGDEGISQPERYMLHFQTWQR